MNIENFGVISYNDGMNFQLQGRSRVLSGKSSGKIFILQHNPSVITLGRRASAKNLLFSEQTVKSKGYEIVDVNRAGDITVHEIGQVVLYFILPVKSKNSKQFIDSVFLPLQRFFDKEYSLLVKFNDKFPGLWVEDRKLSSMGFDLTGGVSMHGVAINVSNTLEGFSLIAPCGMKDVKMTSLSMELGKSIDIDNFILLLKNFLVQNFQNLGQ